MRILVYGGTRFIGKKVVWKLLKFGHEVTLISRRETLPHPRLTIIKSEREDCYKLIVDKSFDRILDFIGYDIEAVKSAVTLMPNTPYIFISTAWIDVFETGVREFLPHEINYLKNKIEAEKFLKNIYANSGLVTICRLPITFGEDDHSERLKFYIRRILVNKSLFLPAGGTTMTQIAFCDDVAWALQALVETHNVHLDLIYDVLPVKEISLAEFAGLIMKSLQVKAKIISCDLKSLKRLYPEYLKIEPLWREGPYRSLYPNLFQKMQVPLTRYDEWLKVLCSLPEMKNDEQKHTFLHKDFLAKELALIKSQ